MTTDKAKIDILPILDDLGPASISVSSRRIDALATALEGHKVDLLASDDRDLTQLAALRRLGPHATVLFGTQQPRSFGAQPLTAILTALRDDSDPAPEQLAEAIVSTQGEGLGGVALRSAKGKVLLETLDTLAANPSAKAKAAVQDVASAGGDLSRLTRALKSTGDGEAATIDSEVKATVIASASGDGALGISLDDPGVQLGLASPWARLAQGARNGQGEELQSMLADLRQVSASKQPSPAAAVLEYTGAPADFHDFLQSELVDNTARHVALVIRGTWNEASSGSVSFQSGPPLRVVDLARELGRALDRRGRGPLTLLLLDDPKLLRIENAYELKDVAHILATGNAANSIPAREHLQQWMIELIPDCEREAADALAKPEFDPIAPYVQK
ncbi:MAG: hypothetical protein KC431_18790, partial [Myxococcales bacterium]|nr:hypothetical protein [Myxococcales bacterium]